MSFEPGRSAGCVFASQVCFECRVGIADCKMRGRVEDPKSDAWKSSEGLCVSPTGISGTNRVSPGIVGRYDWDMHWDDTGMDWDIPMLTGISQ